MFISPDIAKREAYYHIIALGLKLHQKLQIREFFFRKAEYCNDAVTAYTLLAMLFESQSSPSYRPSPEVAHVLWIYL